MSGTTAVAAKSLGLTYYGFEIDTNKPTKILEIIKNHFLSSARFRSAFQPHYIAKKEMIERI